MTKRAILWIDADNTVRLRGLKTADDNAAVTSGLTGTAKVTTESDKATALATTSTWTYDSTNLWWAATLAKPGTALTDGGHYLLIITLTAPGDDYQEIPCVARYRGKA